MDVTHSKCGWHQRMSYDHEWNKKRKNELNTGIHLSLLTDWTPCNQLPRVPADVMEHTQR